VSSRLVWLVIAALTAASTVASGRDPRPELPLPTLPTTTLTLPTPTLTIVTTTLTVPTIPTTTPTLPPTTLTLPATTTLTIVTTLPVVTTTTLLIGGTCALGCDDGASCTDDTCSAGECVHVPVDSRCVPSGQCTNAVCAPGAAGADAEGCLVGLPQPDGAPCAEDTDPCTSDICRGGACVHDRSTDTSTCAPVQAVFRQTIALREATRDLMAEVTAAGAAGVDSLLADLDSIDRDLAAAESALAGDQPGPAPMVAEAVASAVPASLRARIAFTAILRTPREIANFLHDVGQAQQQAQITRAAGHLLRRGGRRLLAGTKRLKVELRRLKRQPRASHHGAR